MEHAPAQMATGGRARGQRAGRYRVAVAAAMILLLAALAAIPEYPAAAAGPVTFTSVTPSVLPMVADYSTDLRGHTWDFAAYDHYSRSQTAPGFVNGGKLKNGWFVGTTANSDPKVWVQEMNLPGTNVTGSEGQSLPVDTSAYRYFTVRLCVDKAAGLVTYWFRDPGTFGAAGFRQAAPGCGIYSFDLVTDRLTGEGSIDWKDGPVQTLAVKFFTPVGTHVRVDFATLTPGRPDTGPEVTANWTGGANAFDLFVSTAANGADPSPIATGVDGAAGSFDWTTPNLAPGRYYLVAVGGGEKAVSPPFTVNSPPQGAFLSPSFTSGPDYATLSGDPWDMSQSSDIQNPNQLTEMKFTGGIFSAINTGADPHFELNLARPIDPSRFYYLTYRMRLEDDASAGARVIWWNGNPLHPPTTLRSIPVYDGWRDVTLDLRTALTEPGSTEAWGDKHKVVLRFDPLALTTPTRFFIDDMKLTANDVAVGGFFAVRYTVADSDGDKPKISLFYDTDREGFDGKPLHCLSQSGAGAEATCNWSMSGIANGDYYVYMVLDDGRDTIRRYSDTPVEVRIPKTPPTLSLSVPGLTNRRDIAITVSGSPDAAAYLVSDKSVEPKAGDPRWAISPPDHFQLSTGDGTKRLYAWAKNAAGLISRRQSAKTLLDTTAPKVTITAPADRSALPRLASIAGTARDPARGSGLQDFGSFAIQHREGSDCTWWNPRARRLEASPCDTPLFFAIKSTRSWRAVAGRLDQAGDYTLLVRFTDRAGNTSRDGVAGETSARFSIQP